MFTKKKSFGVFKDIWRFQNSFFQIDKDEGFD